MIKNKCSLDKIYFLSVLKHGDKASVPLFLSVICFIKGSSTALLFFIFLSNVSNSDAENCTVFFNELGFGLKPMSQYILEKEVTLTLEI